MQRDGEYPQEKKKGCWASAIVIPIDRSEGIDGK